MSQQYFDPMPVSESREREITFEYRGNTCRCLTDAGTFSRDGLDMGTYLMLESVDELPPCRVLDLGCGWGAVGVALGKRYPELDIVMTDINSRAVGLARRNLAENGVSATVLQGDGFAAVEGRFDAIVTNPPIRAGKAVVYALFAQAREHLNPGGALYAVVRKQQGAPSALKYLREIYSRAETIDRGSGFHVIRAEI